MKKFGSILIFFLCFSALYLIDQWQLDNWESDKKNELDAALNLYQTRLKSTITSRFNAIESLASLFVLHPKTTPIEFSHFAGFLLEFNPPIRAIQYADSDTRVIYVYPPKGNEITIKKPMILLTDPERVSYVKKAIQEKKSVLQGPFELRQGGAGVVVRFPIFRGKKFLGLSIGVYDIPVLAGEALKGLNLNQFAFHLKDSQGNLFWSSGRISADSLSKELSMAGSTWTVVANRLEPLLPPMFPRALIWFLGLGFLLAVLTSLQIAWKQGQRLKKEVQERTRDLSNSNDSLLIEIAERKQLESSLQQAQKMESIGNLAGGIAHDFNNLLFPILGRSEMLLEDLPLHSLEHENAQEIFNAGKRAGDLVKQILAFSRQSEHTMTPVRIQNILQEVLKLIRSTLPSDIEVSQDIQADCGLVKADAAQIHQVAMNLITNAYHAVEGKSGKISVQLKQTIIGPDKLSDNFLKQGQYALLIISDTGIGIEPELIGKIFEPYYTTKEPGKGTGLGLAVTYGIVKEHQGNIKVYSELGKGTIFKVYFPLMKKNEDIILTGKFSESATGKENILLVDDEESVAGVEKLMLVRLGYTVTKHTKISKALNEFNMNPEQFDLVITDMTMPNMTGDQLAQKMKEIRSDIPIIVCTGFSERITKEKAEAVGINGLLMKPVTKSDMAKMVRKVLDED